jgi:RNA polymerase sigma factor for flagellar operon FliA
MNIPSHEQLCAAENGNKPPLPTKQTIADGVMLHASNAAWLSLDDKYTLFQAVTALVKAGHKDDDVLNAIGVTRQIYYGRIWFSEKDQKAYEDKKKQEAAAAAEPETADVIAHEPKAKKPGWTLQGKIDAVDEVRRSRYEGNITLAQACALQNITVQRFYKWDSLRHVFLAQIRKKERPKVRAEKNGSTDTDSISLRRRGGRKPIFVPLKPETVEERKKLVEGVHELVTQGKTLGKAAKEKGITSKLYHQWSAQIQREQRASEEPKALLEKIKSNDGDTTALRTQFIESMTPVVTRIADTIAYKMSLAGIVVDTQQLISVGLFEGVVQNIDEYDPTKGTPFRAYFSMKIHQRMQDEMRRQDWIPRVERIAQKGYAEKRDQFFKATGRLPTNESEFRDFFQIADDETLVTHTPMMNSMDAQLPYHSRSNDRAMTLHDFLREDTDNVETFAAQRDFAENILSKFSGDARAILQKYYVEGFTMKETGEYLGLSEARISQMHKTIMKTIRKIVEHDPDMPPIMNGEEN